MPFKRFRPILPPFITSDNIGSHWLLFEAGAISKHLDNSRVCPVIFGIRHSDLPAPLRQYQATEFKNADFKQLLKTVSNASGESRLPDSVLERVFEKWWPDLERNFTEIIDKARLPKEVMPVRSDREPLEEISDLCRFNTARLETTMDARLRHHDVIPYGGDDDFVLRCPNCGFQFMHQERVEVFDRGEDDDMVRKTVVDESGVTSSVVPNDGSGNPSYRRQGLRIFLACENCNNRGGAGPWVGPRKILNIVQHKGETLISWERR